MILKIKKKGFLKFVHSVFFLLFLFIVSFQVNAEAGCCKQTTTGDYCINVDDDTNCVVGEFVPGVTCDSVSSCEVGCCEDTVSGVCGENVAEAVCEDQLNTNFYEDNLCDSVPACVTGCCEVGNPYAFVTARGCQLIVDAYYPGMDWMNVWDSTITDPLTCAYGSSGEDEGCCVDSDSLGYVSGCDWRSRSTCSTTGQEDLNTGGPGFYQNLFCSDPRLQCGCTTHDYLGCGPVGTPEEEDVFWYDSCGNVEDQYADCDPFGLSGGSVGTICKSGEGTASCESVDCADTTDFLLNDHDSEMGGYRQNGESWCVYQANPGMADDMAGSRHYKARCSFGEEIIESCVDFRDEFCVQEVSNDPLVKNTAQCISNDGIDCATECNVKPLYSNEADNRDCCNNYDTCNWVENANTNDVGACLPMIPPGLEFNDLFENSGPSSEASDVCSAGTVTCRSSWRRPNILGISSGSWSCRYNCHCDENTWARDMNSYCKSMGDCGGHYNLEGEFTRVGLSVSGVSFSAALEPDFAEYQTTAGEIYQSLKFPKRDNRCSSGGGWASWWSDWECRTHKFTCESWAPPPETSNCGDCKDLSPDGFCTEYLCRSLGRNCEYINGDDPVYADCLTTEVNDPVPPQISPDYAMIESQQNSLGQNYVVTDLPNAANGGFDITPDANPYTGLNIGIITNEPARCKYDRLSTSIDFDAMLNNFNSFSTYSTEHNFTFLPLLPNEEYLFYVRCVDFWDNGFDDIPYIIRFNTMDIPDSSPPVVIPPEIPPRDSSVAYGNNGTNVIIYWNEPIETCRWDYENIPFDMMDENNTLFCGCDAGAENACTGTLPPENTAGLCDYLDESGGQYTDRFPCVGFLPGIQPGIETEYHIRCVDIQKVDGSGCNQGYHYYNLEGSYALDIVLVEPLSGSVLFYPDFVLSATTASGSDNGNAVCDYNDGIYGWNEFFTTGNTWHTQEQNRTEGNYNYQIRCEDSAGNIAYENTTIIMDVDLTPPEVINLYAQLGRLYLITDELSTCEYTNDDPYFNIGEGELMDGSMVTDHSTLFDDDIYYIKCYDIFNNVGSVITVYDAE